MKAVLAVIIILVVLVVAVLLGGFLYIDTIAEAGVERGATYALGVNTDLESADVKVFQGEFGMSGLHVANPEGFESPHFVSLGSGGMAVTLGTLREQTVELPHLTLTDLDVNLERREGKSNYDVILENVRRLETGEKPAEDAPNEKRFIVREIDISNVTIHVDMLPIGGELTTVEIPIEQIRLTNVGSDSDKGLLLAELSGVIVKAIMAAAVENGGGLIPADMLNDLQQGLAQLEPLSELGIGLLTNAGEGLQDISGAADQLLKGVGEGVGEGLEGVGEGIQDIGEQGEEAIKGIGDILGGKKDKQDEDN